MGKRRSKKEWQLKAQQYLNGKLSPEEATAFEERIKSDPLAFEYVKHLLILHAAMQKERREKIAASFRAVQQDVKTRRRRLLLAASIAIIGFVGFFAISNGRSSTKRKFRKMAEARLMERPTMYVFADSALPMMFPMQDWLDSLPKVESPEEVSVLQIAFQDSADLKTDSITLNLDSSRSPIVQSLALHFSTGDFPGISNDIHEDLQVDSLQTDEERFFWGIHCIFSEAYEDAVDFLEEVGEDSRYAPKAWWYLALCYLHLNQPEMALEALEKLSKQNGYKKRETDELLLEIEKILGGQTEESA